MAIDKTKMKVITKLFDGGYTDEKAISAIGIRELVSLRFTAEEAEVLFEIQNAIKKNKIIYYLGNDSSAFDFTRT